MNEHNNNNKEEKQHKSLIAIIENSFDWNLIVIVSIWIFLLMTSVLIYF